MSLEDRGAQHDKQHGDKFVTPAAAYQMTTLDYVVRPSATGVSGPFTINLPPVAEAKGRFYSIVCRKADLVNTITIADRDDSECWPGDITLNGKCDRALLYSDGLTWHVVSVLTFAGTTAAPTSAPTTAPTTEQ